MKYSYITVLFATLVGFLGKSQDNVHYTEYMYNMNLVNPAYAVGIPYNLDAGLIYKSQWVSAVGNPKMFSFFGRASLLKNIELGLNITNNNIGNGIQVENSFLVDAAYLINFKNKYTLSLGIKTGLSMFNTNGFSDFKLESGINTTDPAFAEDINQSNLNVGVGAYFYTQNYYLGISTPNFLENNVSRASANNVKDNAYYLMGGYVYTFNENVKVKPSMLFRYFLPSNNSVMDLSLNTLLYKRFEVGVSFRLEESFSAMFIVNPIDFLKIGYAYDFTNSDLGRFSSGSHEFMILYSFNLFATKEGYIKSPRFF